jgi:hypothetical protein
MNTPCPHLPLPERALDWHHLHQSGAERGSVFYLRCLEYAQHLWLHATPARSLLAVDRALLSRVRGDEPEVTAWPLPYAAITWILEHAGPDLFLGNPRVHYQHLADRVRGPGHETKRWRSWACWHLVRAARPEFEADPRHRVDPPDRAAVGAGLIAWGIAGEDAIWRKALNKTTPEAPAPRPQQSQS